MAMIIEYNLRSKYDMISLKETKLPSMVKKELSSILLLDKNSDVREATQIYFNYKDGKNLFLLDPFARKHAIKDFKDLIVKINDLELRNTINGNINYLENLSTASQKGKEFATAIGINVLNFLFPFLFYRRQGSDF